MVNGSSRGNSAWFDIRGIQQAGTVDTGIRSMIMTQFRRAIRLLAPADIVNMGLGLSSTPGVDMSGDDGEVLVQLQQQNEALQTQNNQLSTQLANLQANRQGVNP
jgi:hypothetical protein|tara:strand:- start:106 stop:420 length:315 start_codon:yes stop_codon:yes gene_type:complete